MLICSVAYEDLNGTSKNNYDYNTHLTNLKPGDLLVVATYYGYAVAKFIRYKDSTTFKGRLKTVTGKIDDLKQVYQNGGV